MGARQFVSQAHTLARSGFCISNCRVFSLQSHLPPYYPRHETAAPSPPIAITVPYSSSRHLDGAEPAFLESVWSRRFLGFLVSSPDLSSAVSLVKRTFDFLDRRSEAFGRHSPIPEPRFDLMQRIGFPISPDTTRYDEFFFFF